MGHPNGQRPASGDEEKPRLAQYWDGDFLNSQPEGHGQFKRVIRLMMMSILIFEDGLEPPFGIEYSFAQDGIRLMK